MKRLDKTRLSLEFEKCKDRGCGKTIHKLVRALAETDLGEDIIFVIPHSHLVKHYLMELLWLCEEMGYEVKAKYRDKVILDNNKMIFFVPEQAFREREMDFKSMLHKNTTIIYDV